jgi:DNA mismatch repair protein MutL
MPIRLLPPEVAGKIAAGEVVERPASVIKELVENSIDAGSTRISVEIRDGGRRLMRVADDGCGIPAAEVTLAFARHATSKLADVGDLDHISTLGFRGEALASIAAVSQVTVLTRPRDQDAGLHIRVKGGEIIRQESRGSPAGTIITVEHLFNNVPARLKFLRRPQTETGHIHDVVTRYALAHPKIRFSLETDGRQSFQSTGSDKLYDVLLGVFGLDIAGKMLRIADPDPAQRGPTARGYIGSPELHRANRRLITLFVNRRWVQERSLSHAVAQAYHTLLPVGRHPVAVVFLELDPSEVDVNVHPTKREVRFRDGRAAFSAVQRVVRRTLVEQAPVPSFAHSPRTWPSSEWLRQQGLRAAGQDQLSSQMAMELYRPSDRPSDSPGALPIDDPLAVGPVRLPVLRVVGQVGQTYVVAEGPQAMYLIDQHAAHERVIYEQMVSEYSKEAVTSQSLLEPVTLDLDPLLRGTLGENLTLLNQVGFDLQLFGGDTYLLRAVPAVLDTADLRAALVDILELLSLGDDPLAASADERLIAAVCKRAAVKAGQALSHEEMQALVRKLEQCESPRTCPHGRPTVLHFSVEQLEKEFGRL